MKSEIYQDNAGEVRWRLKNDNGEVTADSAEGYTKKRSCKKSVVAIRENANTAKWIDLTEGSE